MRDYIHFCEVSSIIERNHGVLFIYEGRLPFLEDDSKFDSRILMSVKSERHFQVVVIMVMLSSNQLNPYKNTAK